MKDARIRAQRFFARVACVFAEGFVDINNVAVGIGDDDRCRALANGFGQHAQGLLILFALGDVLDRRKQEKSAADRDGAGEYLDVANLAVGQPVLELEMLLFL